MNVDWSQNAVERLVAIFEYIALNSPAYAMGMVHRITRRSSESPTNPSQDAKYQNMMRRQSRVLGAARACARAKSWGVRAIFKVKNNSPALFSVWGRRTLGSKPSSNNAA
jgi:plasmid stabilization system protein ParE